MNAKILLGLAALSSLFFFGRKREPGGVGAEEEGEEGEGEEGEGQVFGAQPVFSAKKSTSPNAGAA